MAPSDLPKPDGGAVPPTPSLPTCLGFSLCVSVHKIFHPIVLGSGKRGATLSFCTKEAGRLPLPGGQTGKQAAGLPSGRGVDLILESAAGRN